MATSGQLNTNTAYDSYFWVKWSQASQDIAANKTKINWSCGVYCGHNFLSNAIKMSAVIINGVQVYGGGTYSNFYGGDHTIASGTLEISHGTDGKKTFSISPFTGWLYSNYNYSSTGKSYELTTIPRQATITAAPDFTDEDNPEITYSNPAGNSVTELKACISLTGATDDIKYRDISKTGSSYTFNLTDSEKDLLRNNTSGTSRSVIFYVRTKIGNATYYSTISKNFTVTENDKTMPKVSMEVSLDNGQISEEYGGMCIQGKSKVVVKLSAEGQYGASIQSYMALVDGLIYKSDDFTSDVLNTPGEVSILGSAKDSRGFTGYTETQYINVIPYVKPAVIPIRSENAILCYRSDESGKMAGNSTKVRIKAKRYYSGLNGKNVCPLKWRRKLASEAWNDATHTWSTLIIDSDDTNVEYNALVTGEFALEDAYTIQVMAVDDIGEYDIKTFDIPTRDVALHLGKGGKNVSIGEYCDYSEDHTFSCSWKAIFKEDVEVNGMSLKDYILSVINGGG